MTFASPSPGGPLFAKRTSILGKPTSGGHGKPWGRGEGERFSKIARKYCGFLWIAVLFAAFSFSLPSLHAATLAETNAFIAARTDFDRGFWDAAEKGFAEFTYKYTNSEFYTPAVVYQAQALLKQRHYTDAIYLLSTEQPRAGALADQFAWWTGQGQLALTNYSGAADTFARLLQDYTNSAFRLGAAVNQAEALAKLNSWSRVIEVLHDPTGPFQQFARTDLTNSLVVAGLLRLGEADLAQRDWAAAEAILRRLGPQQESDTEWRRQYLLGRAQLGAGRDSDALQASAKLQELSSTPLGAPHRPESAAFYAEVLEHSDQLPQAIAAYQQNLGADVPAELRQQALLKIVELCLRQSQVQAATTNLQEYLSKYPAEKASGLARLTLGELKLRQYYEATQSSNLVTTNLLQEAITNFAGLVDAPSNSIFRGKPEFNLGWCFLIEGKKLESDTAFSNAIVRLPFSEDQAVARFKLADAQYQRGDFAGALANYAQVIQQYRSLPSVTNSLFEPALYQMVGAALKQNNPAAANEAMSNLLAWFPNGALVEPGMLLMGQGLTREGEAARAREMLSAFITRSPESPLLPEVRLALARTYEITGDWTNAISQYGTWLNANTDHPARQKAEFALAWANSAAGYESNALTLFTNFITRYPNSDLAPLARYLVADHYWRQDDFYTAELNYKEVFQNWTNSPLADRARMDAGRAAMNSEAVPRAIEYFTNLTSRADIPPALWLEAAFAYGDALMKTVNVTNYTLAMKMFADITNRYATNASMPLALGRLADCCFTLAGLDPVHYRYEAAATNYQMVMDSPLADTFTRSQGECKLGQTLEKLAELKQSGADQTELRNRALAHYLNVVNSRNVLQPGEKSSLYWVEKAITYAGQLTEALAQSASDAGHVTEARELWKAELNLYRDADLRNLLPSMRPVWDRRIARVQEKFISPDKPAPKN